MPFNTTGDFPSIIKGRGRLLPDWATLEKSAATEPPASPLQCSSNQLVCTAAAWLCYRACPLDLALSLTAPGVRSLLFLSP